MENIKFDGDKLFQYRKQKRLSQEKLALAIGVSRQTIYLWESNQSVPDIEKVSKICKVLEINMSDLIKGMEKTINVQEEAEESDRNEEKVKVSNKKRLGKILLMVLLLMVLLYVLISTIKFIRVTTILNKWKKLDEIDSYYMKVQEFLVDKSVSRNDILENAFYEKYYRDNIAKVIWRDYKDESVKSIMIYDYNLQKKYMLDENTKTYTMENIDNQKTEKLTDVFKNYFEIDNYYWNNYFMCLKPSYQISLNKNLYEVNIDNYVKKYINKETGILEYEEIIDNSFRQTRTYYTVELNTQKDFSINLEDYTEVLQ